MTSIQDQRILLSIGVGGIDGVGLSSGTSGSFDNTLNWFEVLNSIEKQNVL
jgi:hypothetical protein